MNRKVVLIGTRSGSWVRTKGLRNLRLDAQVHQDSLLKVLRRSDEGTVDTAAFVGPGKHSLDPTDWIQVHIIDGPFEHSICQLLSA